MPISKMEYYRRSAYAFRRILEGNGVSGLRTGKEFSLVNEIRFLMENAEEMINKSEQKDDEDVQ